MKVTAKLKGGCVVVDTANMLWRAFSVGTMSHRNGNGMSHNGKPTGHVAVLCNMLMALRRRYRGYTLVFAIESGQTSRYDIDPDYKANRRDAQDVATDTLSDVEGVEDVEIDYFGQMYSVIENLACRVIRMPKEEADDAVAYYAKYNPHRYLDMVIISSDKDLWSLLQYKHVSIYGQKKDKYNQPLRVSAKYCLERLGVPPEKVLLYKTILGDPSDNIPRVPRVREKKIVAAVNQVANLTEFYEKLDDLDFSKKEKQRFRDFADRAEVNQRLVSFKTHRPIAHKTLVGSPQKLRKFLNGMKCRTDFCEDLVGTLK